MRKDVDLDPTSEGTRISYDSLSNERDELIYYGCFDLLTSLVRSAYKIASGENS